MSLKKVEQVKADRGFKIWDLLVYGVIVALVAALFIVVFTTRNSDPLSGVAVYVKAQTVFEYEFGGEPKIYSDTVEVKEDNGAYTVTVRADNGDLNIIYIDKSAKTVKMKSANCRGQHCTYFPEMTDNSGFIYCEPHNLKIEPLLKNYDSPDVIV